MKQPKMDPKDQAALLRKFLNGAMTADEIARFKAELHAPEAEAAWINLIGEALAEKNDEVTDSVNIEALYHSLQSRIAAEPQPLRSKSSAALLSLFWTRVAVALLIVVSTIGYFVWNKESPAKVPALVETDVAPGKNGAILTLADGRQVVLDSLNNGLIAMQSGQKVLLEDGQLSYETAEGELDAEETFNTITTPQGRQFGIALPDGSRVWLNAGSSLKYPVRFRKEKRSVEITGEAYFEVIQETGSNGARIPFTVNVDHQAEVEVLGTSFNISAYANEPEMQATLLEGAVRLSSFPGSGATNKHQVQLKPGQQAVRKNGEEEQPFKVRNGVDTDKVMAWKNGLFNFDNASLEEVMRQLERWYNIEVMYEKGVPDIVFGGKLRRDLTLNGVLKSLEESEVRFRLEGGRRLIVNP